MADSEDRPKIGQIVRIVRGRDAGNYAVIVKIEDEKFVHIADGDKRTFNHPKKKNINHIEFLECVSQDVRDLIVQTGRVTSVKLRYALAKFLENNTEGPREGE